MCQACDATTADKCTGCYNKGNDTTFNARALATNACANVITTAKVTGCKAYNGVSDGTTFAYNTCIQCATAAEWLIITNSDATTTTAMACGAMSATNTTCSTNGAIASCLQNTCHSVDGGTTWTFQCAMCNSGLAGGSASLTEALGSSDCVNTAIVANCAFHVVSGTATATTHCYSCSTGYAVASTLLACTAYTTDTNCRVLLADGACGECVTGYYWNGAICGLTALVSVLSTMSLAILALLN